MLLTAEPPRRQRHQPLPAAAAGALSAQLREQTRAAHVAAEESFALEARLASREAYADLLVALRGFYAPVEAALVAAEGWERLTPLLGVDNRCRAAWIDEDLARLGRDVQGSPSELTPPVLGSLAQALGCLYVLEGSALGGRVIARLARRALGEDLPVAFFSSAGRTDLGADWRALQSALDAFGTEHPPVRGAVVAAAEHTFRALTTRLEDQDPQR